MHRIAALGLTALFCFARQAQADDKPAPAGPPKPAAELARLKPLQGNWTCNGASPAGAMGPGSPEMKYASTFKAVPAADGFGWTLTYDQKRSKAHPMHFQGYWTVGWDGAKQKLVFFWIDNAGSVGTQLATDWTGDDLVLTGDGFGFGQHASFRDTLTRKGDKGLHWKGEFKPDSAPGWVTIGEDDCKR